MYVQVFVFFLMSLVLVNYLVLEKHGVSSSLDSFFLFIFPKGIFNKSLLKSYKP